MRRIGFSPALWGIPARSAVVSASVVFVALLVAGAGLVAVLNATLLNSIDGAAGDRVNSLASALRDDLPAEVDAALFSTDERVVAVQLINEAGQVVRHAAKSPAIPMISAADIGAAQRSRVIAQGPDDSERVVGQRIHTPEGDYTILVAGNSESVEATLETVALLLGVAAPIVIAAAAAATYRLVKRSLRSVDAIRVRVSDISTSDLSERVPVPEHRDEVSALARTMNAMLARIEEGHTAQRRFVGDASHELRSPLAALISALEVGSAHPDLLDTELMTGTLLPEAYRMQALIDDLLLLARADEHRLIRRREDIDLDDLAQAAVVRLRRTTTHTVHTAMSPTRLTGDTAAVERVLRNLLDNAERHARSRIDVSTYRSGSGAELVVSDDGPGIPSTERLRVFDRFVRLDSARSRGAGGTGLGLSIVAEIVTAHDGQVTIGDRPGGGTAVRVSFPSRQ